jgi:ribonuclease D
LFLANSAALEDFCAKARSSDIVAVDTEFIRERTYWPRLCLVQLATEDEIALVDPLAIDDLSSLGGLMADEGVTKVFHACSQDLEVLCHVLGDVPRPVFDTQLAAAFLGQRLQIGYGALVEAYCGVSLEKGESLTDWSIRPLDEKQLRYAEDDVRYLPRIYRTMIGQLSENGRLGWVEPEMRALSDESSYIHDPRSAYLRLKRSSRLTRKQLAVAREVAAWREETAIKRDIVRKWVLQDEVVVEIAKRCPKSVSSLERIRGTQQLKASDAQAVVAAVQRGLAVPADEQPTTPHKPHLAPESEGVVDLMNALVRVVSDKEGIAAPVIGSHDDLIAFMSGDADCRLRQSWRYELVGKRLDDLLNGRIGLTVKEGRIELL